MEEEEEHLLLAAEADVADGADVAAPLQLRVPPPNQRNLLPGAGPVGAAVADRDLEMRIPPRSSVAKISPGKQLEEPPEEQRLAE